MTPGEQPDAQCGSRGTAGPRWALLLHGGAGAIARGALRPEQEAAYRSSLAAAAQAGAALLDACGTAVDAVEATVRMLEDDPLFNAGRGAAFTANGTIELDAAIMDGHSLAAGAVAGVRSTRNPVSLARAVMARSPHVLLAGAGADEFAREAGVEAADAAWFFTARRWQSLERFLVAHHLPVPPRPPGAADGHGAQAGSLAHDEGVRGTVGAVALDKRGHVAAATSTGGITGKRPGRVGDSPLIGAGTYASNRACALSATGTGEHFIRLTLTRSVAALVELRGLTLQAAMDAMIHGPLGELGGEGGVIGVTPDGQLAWSMNTSGMYRARISSNSALHVALHGDEP